MICGFTVLLDSGEGLVSKPHMLLGHFSSIVTTLTALEAKPWLVSTDREGKVRVSKLLKDPKQVCPPHPVYAQGSSGPLSHCLTGAYKRAKCAGRSIGTVLLHGSHGICDKPCSTRFPRRSFDSLRLWRRDHKVTFQVL